MVANNTQPTYSERISEAVAGMPGHEGNWDVITRNCETAAGLAFGIAVGRGVDDGGCVIGSAIDDFLGVTRRDVTLVNTTVDKYAENQNVGIQTYGPIWVQYSSTAPTPADPVHFSSTTGVFAITGGTGPVIGARWIKTGANGLALLQLPATRQAA